MVKIPIDHIRHLKDVTLTVPNKRHINVQNHRVSVGVQVRASHGSTSIRRRTLNDNSWIHPAGPGPTEVPGIQGLAADATSSMHGGGGQWGLCDPAA